MFAASSWYHDSVTLELRTPYVQGFVDDLKDVIPPSHRTWNPDGKTWRVTSPYDTVAARILRKYFPEAHTGKTSGQRKRQPKEAYTCRCDSDHRALYICQDAPPEVVQAAYRALAKATHPDRGGDHAAMQRLNAAYARLESGVR